MDMQQREALRPAGAPAEADAGRTRGTVVFHPCKAQRNPRSHESVTQSRVAMQLAEILGCEFGGDFDPACRYGGALYFVPSDTLPGLAIARGLGIRDERDLFGGVVPHPFVATKTITHALPEPGSPAPQGWSEEFARRVREVVLPGHSAFTRRDARAAFERLRRRGPVRLKKASGIGGSGQGVITEAGQLDAFIGADEGADGLLPDGLVLEHNLSRLATYGVGQVRVGELIATYYGTQRLTTNNRGEEVYGGSALTVVRGGFEELLRIAPAPEIRTAIDQARTYHDAALQCFPGLFASRCNYDVAQGTDENGCWYSGVLEQSWRVGGASGAEIAALQAFRADPALPVVRACTVEVYGENPPVPPDACVYFSGDDAHVGPITKYSRLQDHEHP